KFDGEIIVDGRSTFYSGLTDVVVNGTAVYAGFWVLDRHQEPDDGRFEVTPIVGRRDWLSKALRDLAQVPIWQEHLDQIGVTHVEGASGSTIELFLRRAGGQPVPAQVDGEEWQAGRHFRL